MNISDLHQHFEPADIEFRAGKPTETGQGLRAMALAYLTARAVMDRLDSVCGPENWRDEYQPGPSGGVVCGISIRIGDEWITKFDGAPNSEYEAVKGGLSDSFKRAAVKWGIGRYLYALPTVWVRAEKRGKAVIIDEDEARAKMFGGEAPAPAPAPVANATQRPTKKAGKPQPKPGPRVAGDATSQFWFKVYSIGMSEEDGKQILSDANGNAVLALDIVSSSNSYNTTSYSQGA